MIQEQYDLFATRTSTRTTRSSPSASQCTQNIEYDRGGSGVPSNIKGKDLFDAALWKSPTSTSVFYTFIASLRRKIREEVEHTTSTHKFIRALRDGGRLVRCYTQNIDGLEARDGFCTDMARGKGVRTRFAKKVIEKPRPDGPMLPGGEMDGGCEVVELHGDLRELRCNLCQSLCSWEDDARETGLLSGVAPPCPACVRKSEERQGRGKRGTVIGSLRPNIVLYGEEHPAAQLLAPITTHDLSLAPEILLIMGTSLKVHGLKNLVREFAKAVHARASGKGKVIFVNLTKPAESVWGEILDYWVGMDCDAWVDDLKERRGDIWLRQGELKLPIVKDTIHPGGKARRTKSILQDTAKRTTTKIIRDESDKENITMPPQSQETLTIPCKKAIKTMANSPSIRPKAKIYKAVSRTPKPEQAFLGDPKGPQKLRLKPPLPRPPPNTPSRKVKPVETPIRQLPTPPNSGRSQDKAPKSTKRACEALYEDYDTLESTPTKRRKPNVQIWVDSPAEPDDNQAEELENASNNPKSSRIRNMGGEERFLGPCQKKKLRHASPQLSSPRNTESLGVKDDIVLKRRQIVTVEIPQIRTPETARSTPSLPAPDQIPVTEFTDRRAFAVSFVDTREPVPQRTEKLNLVLSENISWAKFNIQVALALGKTRCKAFSEAKACEVKLARSKRPYRFSVDSRNTERFFRKCTQEATGAEILRVTFHA